MREIVPQACICKNLQCFLVRHFYFDNQKRDTNGKNAIAKKSKPFQLEIGTRNKVPWMMHDADDFCLLLKLMKMKIK